MPSTLNAWEIWVQLLDVWFLNQPDEQAIYPIFLLSLKIIPSIPVLISKTISESSVHCRSLTGSGDASLMLAPVGMRLNSMYFFTTIAGFLDSLHFRDNFRCVLILVGF